MYYFTSSMNLSNGHKDQEKSRVILMANFAIISI